MGDNTKKNNNVAAQENAAAAQGAANNELPDPSDLVVDDLERHFQKRFQENPIPEHVLVGIRSDNAEVARSALSAFAAQIACEAVLTSRRDVAAGVISARQYAENATSSTQQLILHEMRYQECYNDFVERHPEFDNIRVRWYFGRLVEKAKQETGEAEYSSKVADKIADDLRGGPPPRGKAGF